MPVVPLPANGSTAGWPLLRASGLTCSTLSASTWVFPIQARIARRKPLPVSERCGAYSCGWILCILFQDEAAIGLFTASWLTLGLWVLAKWNRYSQPSRSRVGQKPGMLVFLCQI